MRSWRKRDIFRSARGKRKRNSRFFLDGKAVKLDSRDGVHPGEVFGCVDLGCTLLNVLFAVPRKERKEFLNLLGYPPRLRISA